ncbi:MAG TPA: glycoside hydrolase family 3 C-terminal domain-containing protein, partial [Chitinophagaceae bacterium]
LRELIKDGAVSMKTIDQRVADVLRVKFTIGLFDQPYVVNPKIADTLVNNAEAKAMSLQLSREALVLLKNDNNTLPLDKSKLRSILVTGPLAAETNHSVSRYGPSNIKVISVLEGIRSYLGKDATVNYTKGCEIIDTLWPMSELFRPQIPADQETEMSKAVNLANQSDAIIVVLGENERMVGESKSRTGLDLPFLQQALLEKLQATGKPVILVLINGRPLTINWANQYVPAILETWFPGEQGGRAIAESIFGDYNPGGKLPVTFPRSIGQIELNFPYKPGSHAGQPGDGPNGYGRTAVHGPLYAFGHGLSYTTFEYSNLQVNPETQLSQGNIEVSIDVTNTGKRKGDEVVQLYLRDKVSSVTQYDMLLRGFDRITLSPGEKKTVRFTLHPDDLSLLDKNMNWVVEPGAFEVLIASSSVDIRAKKEFVIK